MALSLPEDAEPFLQDDHNFSRLRGAGVYCLKLERPDDLEAAWDAEYEHRPPYFAELQAADGVLYVGASKGVLGRLTDHKLGDKRVTALTEVCEIERLRNIWWVDDPERVYHEESKTALLLQQEHPEKYVHSR